MSSGWEDDSEEDYHRHKSSKRSKKGEHHFTMRGGSGTHIHLHQASHGHGSHGIMGPSVPIMASLPMGIGMSGMPMPMPGGVPMGMPIPGSMPMPGAMPMPGGYAPPNMNPSSHENQHQQPQHSHQSNQEPAPASKGHHSAPAGPAPESHPQEQPQEGHSTGNSGHSNSDEKKQDPRYKEPRHYGYAGGLFFIAGIPLIIWGAGSEIIDKGVPLASDPKTGDAVTIKGFCTHLIKNSDDENECFTWSELSDKQNLPALKGMLKGYSTVHNTHIVAGTFCLVAGLLMLVMCFGMKRNKDLKWWMKDIIGWVVLSLVFGANVIDWTISQSAGVNGFTAVSSSVRPVTDLACLLLASIGFWLAARKGKKEDPNNAAGGAGPFGSHYAEEKFYEPYHNVHQSQPPFGSHPSFGSQPLFGAHPPQHPHHAKPPW